MTDEKPLPPGLALAWGVSSPGRRGPKPAHSVGQIVQAGVELADADGIGALSLPKLATRVGLSTNAIYRYVDSKDELVVLVRDAGWGPPPGTIRRAANWRSAATAWTHAALARYRARPWLLDVPVPGAPMTPNLLRWLETLLAAMRDTGLNDEDCLRCALLLDGYAVSTASLIRKVQAAAAEPAQSAAGLEFLLPRLREQGLPVLAEMLAGGTYGSGDEAEQVDFGLLRVLDGIDALIRAQTPP
ncbi:TetR/AcrR family transcriptional regulator [Flindersiella endophytica]